MKQLKKETSVDTESVLPNSEKLLIDKGASSSLIAAPSLPTNETPEDQSMPLLLLTNSPQQVKKSDKLDTFSQESGSEQHRVQEQENTSEFDEELDEEFQAVVLSSEKLPIDKEASSSLTTAPSLPINKTLENQSMPLLLTNSPQQVKKSDKVDTFSQESGSEQHKVQEETSASEFDEELDEESQVVIPSTEKLTIDKEASSSSTNETPEDQSMPLLSTSSLQQVKKSDEVDTFSQESGSEQHKVQEETSPSKFDEEQPDKESQVIAAQSRENLTIDKGASSSLTTAPSLQTNETLEDQSMPFLSTNSSQKVKKSDKVDTFSQESGSEQHKVQKETSGSEFDEESQVVIPSTEKLTIDKEASSSSTNETLENQSMPLLSTNSPQKVKKSDEVDTFSQESGSEQHKVQEETSGSEFDEELDKESQVFIPSTEKLTIDKEDSSSLTTAPSLPTNETPEDRSIPQPLSTNSPQQMKKTKNSKKISESFSQKSGLKVAEQYKLQEETSAGELDEKSQLVVPSSEKFIKDKTIEDLPPPPNKPKHKNVTYKSISLEWEKFSFSRSKLQYYSVICCVSGSSDGNQIEKKTEGLEESLTIDGLDCNTGYVFKVQANFSGGIKLESEPTGIIHTKDHLAEAIRKNSKPISEKTIENPAIYELNKTAVMIEPSKKIAKYKVGEDLNCAGIGKVLMVVGATGAGKTTLINGIANYMYGIQWEDEFRFSLVAHEPVKKSQAHSHTSWITAYTLYNGDPSRISYPLTIIDTPGFGDTEGIEKDKIIVEQIKEFFSVKNPEGIDVLRGIGFVAQASLARLSHSQKYIFDSILSIYGRDVADNIFIMTTFADGQKPPVMEAIDEAKIPYQKYFKFNNSALFVNGKQNAFDAMFWDMGMNSFESFFSVFGKAENRSLQLTREVLSEREQLENVLQQLQPQIHTGLTKMDELQRVVIMLEHNKTLIEQNKEFVFNVPVTKQRKVDTPTGQYTTNCLNCNYTCHDNCAYANNDDKKKCCAMNCSGDCRICPGNCIWSKHVNNPYIFEIYEEVEVRTSDELKDRYDTAKEGESRAETMINNIKDDIIGLEVIVLDLVDKARKSLMRLDEIALKPNPLSEVDYIDLLIKSEEQQCKRGWMERVASYKVLRKRASLMRRIKVGHNSADDVQEPLFSWLGGDGASSSYTSQTLQYLKNPAEKKKKWFDFWKYLSKLGSIM